MVVFFEGREPIGFDRMKAKTIWQCRHGAFHHDEIIGKPFGSRVSDTVVVCSSGTWSFHLGLLFESVTEERTAVFSLLLRAGFVWYRGQ